MPDNQMNNMACGVLAVSGTPYIYCVGGSAAGQTTATARVFFYNPATDAVTTLTRETTGLVMRQAQSCLVDSQSITTSRISWRV